MLKSGVSMFFTGLLHGARRVGPGTGAAGVRVQSGAPEHSHIPLSRKSAFPGLAGDLPKRATTTPWTRS